MNSNGLVPQKGLVAAVWAKAGRIVSEAFEKAFEDFFGRGIGGSLWGIKGGKEDGGLGEELFADILGEIRSDQLALCGEMDLWSEAVEGGDGTYHHSLHGAM